MKEPPSLLPHHVWVCFSPNLQRSCSARDMPVNREAPRQNRRLREVTGWVFPDERTRSDSATGTTTNTVGTNTGVTALQQLRFLRELRARELRASAEESARVDPCPSGFGPLGSREASNFAEPLQEAECPMEINIPEAQNFSQPGPCSFLQGGQHFHGTQRVSQASASASEDWGVQVTIEEVNHTTGYVCGSMRAENVPQAKTPVLTFWEGDIIDNVNHCFITSKWGADKKIDVKHWPKFDGFEPLRRQVQAAGGRCDGLCTHSHIFMRWKEKNFVNVGDDCGLTIAGFYYICMSRKTGTIEGFYHDPNSSPFQKLQLVPLRNEQRQGYASSCFAFR